MKAIREAAGQDLQWIGIKTKGRFFFHYTGSYELRSGDEVLAMLHARELPLSGEAADGRWTLSPRSGDIVITELDSERASIAEYEIQGMFSRSGDIVITELDSQAEIAVVKHERKQSIFKYQKKGWSEYYIRFSDGRMLTLNKASSWNANPTGCAPRCTN